MRAPPRNESVLLCPTRGPKPDESRRVNLNVAETKFCDNYVATSKYSLLSFLPKSLFEQCVTRGFGPSWWLVCPMLHWAWMGLTAEGAFDDERTNECMHVCEIGKRPRC